MNPTDSIPAPVVPSAACSCLWTHTPDGRSSIYLADPACVDAPHAKIVTHSGPTPVPGIDSGS